MTFCSPGEKAEEALDNVIRMLDASAIRDTIDLPIDMAAANFVLDSIPETIGPAYIAEAAGSFVRHIYRTGIQPPRNLHNHQAEAEAVFLIEAGYEGTVFRGYEGAARDAALYGIEGLEKIMSAVADTVKQRQRRQYTNWVLRRHVESLSLQEKRHMTDAILKRWGQFMGRQITGLPREELVEVSTDIILDHIASEMPLADVMASGSGIGAASASVDHRGEP